MPEGHDHVRLFGLRVDIERQVYTTVVLMSVLVVYDGWHELASFLGVAAVIVAPVLAILAAHFFSEVLEDHSALCRPLTGAEWLTCPAPGFVAVVGAAAAGRARDRLGEPPGRDIDDHRAGVDRGGDPDGARGGRRGAGWVPGLAAWRGRDRRRRDRTPCRVLADPAQTALRPCSVDQVTGREARSGCRLHLDLHPPRVQIEDLKRTRARPAADGRCRRPVQPPWTPLPG